MHTGRRFPLWLSLLLLFYIRNLLAIESQCNHDSEYCQNGHSSPQMEAFSSVFERSDSRSVDAPTIADSPVTFEPPVLDFKQQYVGMPVSTIVKLCNPSKFLTLQLVSLSGQRSEFHSSFFIDKVLMPGKCTSFTIVFLGKVVGYCEDSIIIHSSLGMFQYKVMGTVIENSFYLRPLQGARIPINATYQPSISMYNPFNEHLQISEMYSTSPYLQIELPNGIMEGNKSVWNIRPYETKLIARVNFNGYVVENFTAYIRVKTTHVTEPPIVIPVDITVCESVGLFISREIFDFGIVRTDTESKLSLYLLNAGPEEVEIKIVDVDDNPAVNVKLIKTSLKPGTKYVKVGVLTFIGSLVRDDTLDKGTMKITAEDDHNKRYDLVVPFVAQVMRGSLFYNESQTSFHVRQPPFVPIIQNFNLKNMFEFPVVIYSAKFNSKYQDWFWLQAFNPPFILPADGKNHPVLVFKFTAQSPDCFFNTTLRLATNVSYFNIPLLCYDGRIDFDIDGNETDNLEFGTLSHQDNSSKLVKITNNNPVTLSITRISFSEMKSLPFLTVQLLPLPLYDPREYPVVSGGKNGRTYKLQHELRSGQHCLIRVNITQPGISGNFSGHIKLHSTLGKNLVIPVKYTTVIGVVEFVPNKVNFLPAFFYSPSSLHFSINNTYTKPVKLVSLSIHNTNETISNQTLPLTLPRVLPVLPPSSVTEIDDVILDPSFIFYISKINIEDSYLQCRQSFSSDINHFKQLWSLWQNVVSHGMELFNFSLKTTTEMNEELSITGTASIAWPRLSNIDVLGFSLTLVGNHTIKNIVFVNPTQSPLYIEPVLLTEFDEFSDILSTVSSVYNSDLTLYNSTEQVFDLLIDDQATIMPDSIIIPPRDTFTLQISFRPNKHQMYNSLLLLRNNLTMFDYVKLSGEGCYSFISIEGVYPGQTSQSLTFELTQSILEGYLNGIECGVQITDLLLFGKIFYVRNMGSNPLSIKRISIDDNGCYGRGFHVKNCNNSYIVYPNRTRKIEIICMPDFTVSQISSTLYLHLSDGSSLTFPLLAIIPHHMLSTCYNALPYSKLENYASYLSPPLWIFTLLVMTIATVFNVNKHFKNFSSFLIVKQSSKGVPSNVSLLDLSNISYSEINKNKTVQAHPPLTSSSLLSSSHDYTTNSNDIIENYSSSHKIQTNHVLNVSRTSGPVKTNKKEPLDDTSLYNVSAPGKKPKNKRISVKPQQTEIYAHHHHHTSCSLHSTVDQIQRKRSDETTKPVEYATERYVTNSKQISHHNKNDSIDSESDSKPPSFTKEPLTGQTVKVVDVSDEFIPSKDTFVPTNKKPDSHHKKKENHTNGGNRQQHKETEHPATPVTVKKLEGSRDSLGKESVVSISTTSTDSIDDDVVFFDAQQFEETDSVTDKRHRYEEEHLNVSLDETLLSSYKQSSNEKLSNSSSLTELTPSKGAKCKQDRKKYDQQRLDEAVDTTTADNPVNSAGIDDPNSKRHTGPHDIAASLLAQDDIIVRRGNKKTANSSKVSKTFKKDKSEQKMPNKKYSMDNIDNPVNRSQLSHDARPFYPPSHLPLGPYSFVHPSQYGPPPPPPPVYPPHVASPYGSNVPSRGHHYVPEEYDLSSSSSYDHQQVIRNRQEYSTARLQPSQQQPVHPTSLHDNYYQYRDAQNLHSLYSQPEYNRSNAGGFNDHGGLGKHTEVPPQLYAERHLTSGAWVGSDLPTRRSTGYRHVYEGYPDGPDVLSRRQQMNDLSYRGHQHYSLSNLRKEYNDDGMMDRAGGHIGRPQRKSYDVFPADLSPSESNILNRAPGTMPTYTYNSSKKRSWGQFDEVKDGAGGGDSSYRRRSNPTACDLISPLSSALDEQRFQVAFQLSSAPSPPPPPLDNQSTSQGDISNCYELFESSIPNIWNFSNPGISQDNVDIFSWDKANTNK